MYQTPEPPAVDPKSMGQKLRIQITGQLKDCADKSVMEILMTKLPVFYGSREFNDRVALHPAPTIPRQTAPDLTAAFLALVSEGVQSNKLLQKTLEADLILQVGLKDQAKMRLLELTESYRAHVEYPPLELAIYIFTSSLLLQFCEIDIAQRERLEKIVKDCSRQKNFSIYTRDKKIFSNRSLSLEEMKNYRMATLQNPEVISDSIGDYILKNLEQLDKDKILDLLKSALFLKGIDGRAAENFISAFLYCYNFDTLGEQVVAAKFPDYNIVNVCGFSFSGSSAIFDYINGNEGIHGLTDDALDIELPLVVAFEDMISNNSTIKPQRVASTFFLHLLPIFINQDGLHHVNLKSISFNFFERARRSYGSIDIDFYSSAVLDLMRDLSQEFKSDTKNSITNFILTCAAVHRSQPTRLVLLNQAPQALSLHGARILSNGCTLIVCQRDPRDQYVDLVNHKIHAYSGTVEKFIQTFRRNNNYYMDMKKDLLQRYKLLEVSFEKFVRQSTERVKILKELNLEEYPTSSVFDAKRSQKNVGMYKDFSDQDAIRKVENELSEFLVDLESLPIID